MGVNGWSKRRDDRRKADFHVRTNLTVRYKRPQFPGQSRGPAILGACRKPIDGDELRTLIDAIEKKSSSRFGVVKLSGLELDTLYELPQAEGGSIRTTLIGHAAMLRRAGIVGSLLRAGCVFFPSACAESLAPTHCPRCAPEPTQARGNVAKTGGSKARAVSRTSSLNCLRLTP